MVVRAERRAHSRNCRLFKRAKRFMPGGVNSPVRSFKAVGGHPVFIKKGRGSKLYAEDGRRFIDYCLSWGALILGHAHPEVTSKLREAITGGTSFGAATSRETELARLIVEAFASMGQVRLTSSGTEAVMSAVRLARAYTGRDKIIKFEGSYHGHADYLLVKAGSGAAAMGAPDSLGVPKAFSAHTLVLPFNDIKRLKSAAATHSKGLAAIIVEPVAANCGVILPKPGFLYTLRKICDRHNIVLIFDEVITGFRLSYGGAQKSFGVKADLTCLGKIIGGGLPAGAFGGRRDIMRFLAPQGGAYQAGTLSGNPVAVTAGIAALSLLKRIRPYTALREKTRLLCEHITSKAKEYKVALKVNCAGSMFSLFFTKKDVIDYNTARTQDAALFRRFYHGMLDEGVYLSPSGFEANFLSIRHTNRDIEDTMSIISKVLRGLRRN